jgi:two-component system nitrate/nitrite response regulator NarL
LNIRPPRSIVNNHWATKRGQDDRSVSTVAAASASAPLATGEEWVALRLVIAAGVRLFREGLAEVIESQRSVTVVATAADAASLDEAVRLHEPDILLVDTALEGAKTSLLRLLITFPEVKIVALGEFREPDEVIAYAEAGVAGFVTRDQALDELVRTLESVVRGHLHCPPHVAAALLQRVASVASQRAPARPENAVRLTARELEIAALLGDGLSNKQIAKRLSIEVPTVKNHVHNILEKLQVGSRLDAAQWARGAIASSSRI